MTLSENLVRHLYVATAVPSTGDVASLGDIKLKTTNDGEEIYFSHIGKGGQTRSDLIPVKNILFAKATDESDMEKSLKKVTIALSDNALNSAGNVIKGTYVVRVTIHNYVGMSDEDTYYKYGQVTSNGNMTPTQFYTALKKSLEANLKREVVKMFEIGSTSNEGNTALTNVTITEVEQPWHLGTMARVPVIFDVELVSNDDMFEVLTSGATTTYDWGTVTVGAAATKLKNSKDIADMEYFLMGERADMYRGKGWPNNIPTSYMANGESATGYYVLDIHYAYVGANESAQKSEKTITIVSETKSVITSLVSALESAADLTVSTSSSWS